jgi:hypothetical protein
MSSAPASAAPASVGPSDATEPLVRARAHAAAEAEAERPGAAPPPSRRGAVLFPGLYGWYIIAGTLDILVTHKILAYFGGREVNALADALITKFSEWGLVLLKYATVVVVIAICEFVGRRHWRLARRLAIFAVVWSAFPVGWGLLQVGVWTHLEHTQLGEWLNVKGHTPGANVDTGR